MECNGFELVYGNEEILSIFRSSMQIKRSRDDVPKEEFEKVLMYLRYVEKKYYPKYLVGRILESVGLKKSVKKLLGLK